MDRHVVKTFTTQLTTNSRLGNAFDLLDGMVNDKLGDIVIHEIVDTIYPQKEGKFDVVARRVTYSLLPITRL